MSNQTKLEFRLVPTKGVASGKGFRAEWTRKNEVIDMDAVITEANPPDVDRTAHAGILPPAAD